MVTAGRVTINEDFWRDRRVFVTGHTGFKGSWLTLWLHRLGAQVTGYALSPPTQPNLYTLAAIDEIANSVIGDLDDQDGLRKVMVTAAPEVVMHLAAQPLVHAGYADPVETFRTNLMGTVHVLDAVRQTPGVRVVLNVTTDKCYENREWVWGYREIDRLGGFDPYSSSKACSELATASFRNAFFPPSRLAEHGVAVATARAGNVIGGGDWGADRLVPDLVRAFASGQTAQIRRPDAIRPWQHVLEPLAGYLRLAQGLVEDGAAHASAWNFGPADDDARPVRWIVETMAHLWGEGAAWHLDGSNHPHEAHHLKLDCSKARTELGWQPRLGLNAALDWTVQWYRAQHDGGNARELCEQQIQAYQTRKT